MDRVTVVAAIVGVGVGIALSVFVTPVFCLLRKMFFVPLMRKRFKELAIKKGRVVTATLQKSFPVISRKDGLPTGETLGRYSYDYKGKTYSFSCTTHYEPASELTLYFQKNPRKATLESMLGLKESNWLRYFFVIAIVIAVLATVVLTPIIEKTV